MRSGNIETVFWATVYPCNLRDQLVFCLKGVLNACRLFSSCESLYMHVVLWVIFIWIIWHHMVVFVSPDNKNFLEKLKKSELNVQNMVFGWLKPLNTDQQRPQVEHNTLRDLTEQELVTKATKQSCNWATIPDTQI